MKRAFTILTAFLCLVGFSNTVSAATILNVANDNNYGISLNSGGAQVAGTAFTLNQTYQNVSISAPITCVACSGSIVLHNGSLGGGATAANLVAGFNFSNSVSSLFSGLTLGPGTYFLLAGVTSGVGGWAGSAAGTTTTNGSAFDGLDVTSASASFYIPASSFTPVFSNSQLSYNLSGTLVSAVPLPASALLLIGGLLGLGLLRKPQKSVS